MASAVPAALARSMAWFTAGAISAISADPAGARPRSRPARSSRRPNLPLTTWFLALSLIGQAKTGISSLELSRHLGGKYDTAWLMHNKILRAMSEREEAYVVREISSWMMPTSAENSLVARQAGDR